MAQTIALTTPAALGLFWASSHEPFHVDGRERSMAVTERSGQKQRAQSAHAACREDPFTASPACSHVGFEMAFRFQARPWHSISSGHRRGRTVGGFLSAQATAV
jgi:hypothetical protein